MPRDMARLRPFASKRPAHLPASASWGKLTGWRPVFRCRRRLSRSGSGRRRKRPPLAPQETIGSGRHPARRRRRGHEAAGCPGSYECRGCPPRAGSRNIYRACPAPDPRDCQTRKAPRRACPSRTSKRCSRAYRAHPDRRWSPRPQTAVQAEVEKAAAHIIEAEPPVVPRRPG